MKAGLIVALLTGALTLGACQQVKQSDQPQSGPIKQSEVCRSSGKSKAAVIVIHGGGFVSGDPSLTSDTCALLAANGFFVINLKYPLGDPQGAKRALRQAIKQAKEENKTVYAYGESAGGGLAALAAAKSWIDGAFVWAPVSDALAWKRKINQDPSLSYLRGQFAQINDKQLKDISAINYASNNSAPIVVVHGRDDELIPFQESIDLAKRWPRMRLISAAGGHQVDAPSMIAAPRQANRCFLGQQYCPWAK